MTTNVILSLLIFTTIASFAVTFAIPVSSIGENNDKLNDTKIDREQGPVNDTISIEFESNDKLPIYDGAEREKRFIKKILKKPMMAIGAGALLGGGLIHMEHRYADRNQMPNQVSNHMSYHVPPYQMPNLYPQQTPNQAQYNPGYYYGG